MSGLSQAHTSINQYNQAIDYRLESLHLAKIRRDKHAELLELTALADLYFFVGRYHEAIKLANESIEMAEDQKDQKLILCSLGTAGSAFLALEEFDNCIAL